MTHGRRISEYDIVDFKIDVIYVKKDVSQEV